MINFCYSYGPTPEYDQFVDAMKIIADAAAGVHKDEEAIINSFSTDLIERFKMDIEKKLAFERG